MILKVSDITVKFGGLKANNLLSFNISKGEIVGLIGPNGSGKTTLFNVISGFIKPDNGKIVLDGKAITGMKPENICRMGLCRTFQIVKVFGQSTVLDNVVAATLVQGTSIKDSKILAISILKDLGLDHRAYDCAGKLPIGQRKLLELAKAIATNPKMLLLDEVMGGLNPTESNDIIDIIRRINKKGTTILMIEHIMGVIMKISERIVVIDMGEKIAEGVPSLISHDLKVIKAYLGEKYANSLNCG